MPIVKQIDSKIIEALKGGEKEKLAVLRGLKSAFKYRQIEAKKELSDEMAIEVISRAAKQRRESIEQFRAGEREDLASKEESELKIISEYLPSQLSEEEVRTLVATAVSESGAETPKQIGLVMKLLMPKVKGKADGKLVNRLVLEKLAN